MYGPQRGSRTLNIPGLNRTPLPIGLPTDMVAPGGIEPPTLGSSNPRSTTELRCRMYGPPGGSRTPNIPLLRRTPLPIGLPEDISFQNLGRSAGNDPASSNSQSNALPLSYDRHNVFVRAFQCFPDVAISAPDFTFVDFLLYQNKNAQFLRTGRCEIF